MSSQNEKKIQEKGDCHLYWRILRKKGAISYAVEVVYHDPLIKKLPCLNRLNYFRNANISAAVLPKFVLIF